MRYFLLAASVFLLSCAPSMVQFYPDDYYPEDGIYENKPLRFIFTFSGNWQIETDPEKMDRSSRAFAGELQKSGVELLFIGSTVEGFHGTRGIAINLNEPAREYAEYIRRINKKDIDQDQGLIDFYAGDNPMVKWIYDKSGFRFVEFFFNIGTYDIRISFWTKPDLFEKFLPVYEQIISTLRVTRGL